MFDIEILENLPLFHSKFHKNLITTSHFYAILYNQKSHISLRRFIAIYNSKTRDIYDKTYMPIGTFYVEEYDY